MPATPLTAVPVFYCPGMVADSQGFSPSASKPAAVVERWQRIGIPIEIRAPEPVTTAQFKLAHEAQFVDDILALRRENGFGNCSASVAATLPLTSGAMLCAARAALANGCVAVAPVSGFHHARHDLCGGFCTFNGLVVTARVLLQSGEVSKVGILDFDQHYGDGTQDCIEVLGLEGQVMHYSAGSEYSQPRQAEGFLRRIPQLVADMADCDIMLYQAGADPHVDDPLGGWLTDAQLYERDHAVFRAARGAGLPVAWNLAGGYQTPVEKVLRIHDATLRACAETFMR